MGNLRNLEFWLLQAGYSIELKHMGGLLTKWGRVKGKPKRKKRHCYVNGN